MAVADKCDSKIVTMQQNWREGHKCRSNLSLVLLKEKRTKKLRKLVGRYDHIRIQKIKDVLSSFVFISVIYYASLGNTGRTVRGSPSCMAGSLGTYQFCRPRVLQDAHPGGVSKAEPRGLQPWTCPLCTLGDWLEYYSIGLFSNCSFERKLESTIEQGTACFPLMRKQDAAKHAQRAAWGVPQELL